MKTSLMLMFALCLLASCGKQGRRYGAPNPYDGIWRKNDVSSVYRKTYTPFTLRNGSSVNTEITIRLIAAKTTNPYMSARVVKLDKQWTLSIDYYRVNDCYGNSANNFNKCDVEFYGVPDGDYLLEYD